MKCEEEDRGPKSAGSRSSIPLEELVERQGVAAARSLDEISDLWPADDDPDALMAYILEERSQRRRLTKG
jgi:hypothetical protein